MASVLITGAGGFLGSHLTRVFHQAGYSVRAADLGHLDFSMHKELGVEIVPCDITDKEQVHAAVQGVDLVVHAAGIFNLGAPKDLLWAVNAEGAKTVAEAACQEGVQRLVIVSSTSVYGRGPQNISEDGPKNPTHDYDQSKWAGEQQAIDACEASGVEWTAIRPTLIYGPGGKYGVANALTLLTLRSQFGHRKLPIAQGGPIGHHVHVGDVARATLLVATHPDAVGKAFNVADDVPLEAGELIRILGRLSGVRILDTAPPWWCTFVLRLAKPLIRWFFKYENKKLNHIWGKIVDERDLVPALQPRIDVDWLDYFFHHHSFNNARIKSLGFTFEHPDVRESLTKTGHWYKQNRWLPDPPAAS